MQKSERLDDRLRAIAEELLYRAARQAADGDVFGWKSGLHGLGLVPTNAVTGRRYQGRWNRLFLRVAQAYGGEGAVKLQDNPESSYSTGWWASYPQWEQLGAQVRNPVVRVGGQSDNRVRVAHRVVRSPVGSVSVPQGEESCSGSSGVEPEGRSFTRRPL